MRFLRKKADASEPSTAVAVESAIVPIADDGNIPLIDVEGQGFDLLRSMDLGHSLWRPNVVTELDRLGTNQIVVVAAYTPEDIESSVPLMRRFMTIVLAMGLGPQYGSRALTLGAVGYVDGSRDEGDIRGLFGDAVARVRIRRLREAAA
jgi:hypothetical protein